MYSVVHSMAAVFHIVLPTFLTICLMLCFIHKTLSKLKKIKVAIKFQRFGYNHNLLSITKEGFVVVGKDFISST